MPHAIIVFLWDLFIKLSCVYILLEFVTKIVFIYFGMNEFKRKGFISWSLCRQNNVPNVTKIKACKKGMTFAY